MKTILYGLGILATIGLGTYWQWNYCSEVCEIDTAEQEGNNTNLTHAVVEPNAFTFSSDGVGFVCNQNFNFPLNEFISKTPVGDSVDLGIEELKSYLNNHKDQVAQIVGYYTEDEVNFSGFSNLGLARANNIKNYFIKKGIPSNRLVINGRLADEWDKKDKDILGPISIDLIRYAAASQIKDWPNLKKNINHNPLQLTFDIGESSGELNSSQRKLIKDIVTYMDHVMDSKIEIIGHTDNVGSREGNITMGKEQAEQTKSFLVRNGFTPERIIVSSKGPDEPIADNSQHAGRSKNRRTVVLIK